MGKNQQNGFTTGLGQMTQSQATDKLQQVIQEPQTARKHRHQESASLGPPMN